MWLCAFLWCSSFDILTKLLLSNVHKEELCMQADRLGQKTRWGRWRESNIWFSTPPSHTYWTRWGSLICLVFTQQPLPHLSDILGGGGRGVYQMIFSFVFQICPIVHGSIQAFIIRQDVCQALRSWQFHFYTETIQRRKDNIATHPSYTLDIGLSKLNSVFGNLVSHHKQQSSTRSRFNLSYFER